MFVALLVILVAADGDSDKVGLGGAEGAATVSGPLDVELGDMYITPKAVTVEPGQVLELNVTNKGVLAHDIALDGTPSSGLIEPGATGTVKLGPIEESTIAYCTVPGHREAGMVMEITVAGSAAEADATARQRRRPGRRSTRRRRRRPTSSRSTPPCSRHRARRPTTSSGR